MSRETTRLYCNRAKGSRRQPARTTGRRRLGSAILGLLTARASQVLRARCRDPCLASASPATGSPGRARSPLLPRNQGPRHAHRSPAAPAFACMLLQYPDQADERRIADHRAAAEVTDFSYLIQKGRPEIYGRPFCLASFISSCALRVASPRICPRHVEFLPGRDTGSDRCGLPHTGPLRHCYGSQPNAGTGCDSRSRHRRATWSSW